MLEKTKGGDEAWLRYGVENRVALMEFFESRVRGDRGSAWRLRRSYWDAPWGDRGLEFFAMEEGPREGEDGQEAWLAAAKTCAKRKGRGSWGRRRIGGGAGGRDFGRGATA